MIINSFAASCNGKTSCRILPSRLNLANCGGLAANYLHVDYVCAQSNSSESVLTSTITTTSTSDNAPTSIITTNTTLVTNSATITDAVNNTTSNPNYIQFIDFCPGIGKNIDCSATGDLIYLTDAFYGISSETPAVCAYK